MAEIINLDRLKSKLEDIANPQAMQNALEKACFIVENEAKKKCPVGDGQLRQSIIHEIDGSDGIVGTNVSYAPYVEFAFYFRRTVGAIQILNGVDLLCHTRSSLRFCFNI